MTLVATVLSLALTAWSPATRSDQMASCMRARTAFPQSAPTAQKVCKCAVKALEKACPDEKTLDDCATAQVMQPILLGCKK